MEKNIGFATIHQRSPKISLVDEYGAPTRVTKFYMQTNRSIKKRKKQMHRWSVSCLSFLSVSLSLLSVAWGHDGKRKDIQCWRCKVALSWSLRVVVFIDFFIVSMFPNSLNDVANNLFFIYYLFFVQIGVINTVTYDIPCD